MRSRLLLVSSAVLFIAACSSSDDGDSSATTSPTTTSPTTSPTTAAVSEYPPELDADGKVLFAETINDFVLNSVIAYGEDGLDPANIADAVRIIYPTLSVRGSGIEADGSNISIASNTIDSKSVAGPENPVFVAVATRQVSGECFGAALYGYPLPTERFDANDLTVCTADAVVEALRAELA